MRGYVASGRERLLEPFRTARRTYPAQAERLSRLVADEPRQQAAVRQITTGINDYVALWALPLVGLADERREVAQSVLATGTGRERLDTLRSELATLFARERSVAAERERRADKRSDTAVILGLIGMGLVALVALGMWLGLRRSILRPVERVALATRAVADGDLTVARPRRPRGRDRHARALVQRHDGRAEPQPPAARHADAGPRALQPRPRAVRADGVARPAGAARDDRPLPAPHRAPPPGRLAGGAPAAAGGRRRLDGPHALARPRPPAPRPRGPRRADAARRWTPRAVLDRALENLAGPIEERGADVSAGPLPSRQRRSGPAQPAVPEPPGQRDQVQRPRRAARERHGVDRGRRRRSSRCATTASASTRSTRSGSSSRSSDCTARTATRGPGSASRSASASSATTAGGSGPRARVGAGSTFRFTLPLADASPPPPGPTTTHEPETSHAAAA